MQRLGIDPTLQDNQKKARRCYEIRKFPSLSQGMRLAVLSRKDTDNKQALVDRLRLSLEEFLYRRNDVVLLCMRQFWIYGDGKYFLCRLF
jgi:hypothetical protein